MIDQQLRDEMERRKKTMMQLFSQLKCLSLSLYYVHTAGDRNDILYTNLCNSKTNELIYTVNVKTWLMHYINYDMFKDPEAAKVIASTILAGEDNGAN